VATATAGGLVGRLTDDEPTGGLCTAGAARATAGASTVTGGNLVCALVIEGATQSALQSTSLLALRKA